MVFPEIALVRQNLHAKELQDIPAAVGTALEAFNLPSATKPGESVAVCVGSRGISQISLIVYECVKHLTNNGLKPFIVPAMGSHGGNTPEGEHSVLARLGIDESSVKAPILPAEDVVRIGTLNIGLPVLMDKGAAEADHIVVINRVKPHTKFHGLTESGLTKMLTVGLGKGKGAATYHRAAVQHTFSILHDAARHILEERSVLFGLAVLEDGYNNVSQIRAVGPENWHQAERKLLEEARVMVPRIPFDPIDILIVDEIGKEISGIGMDSNVTGRHRDIVGNFFTPPHAKRIFVRNLSWESDGNANGIGLADVTTQRLVDAIDFEKTYQNALTAISPEKAAVPMHFDTDRECVETCLNTIGMVQPEAARIVRIKNTATLETLWISRALEAEARSKPEIQVLGSWEPMRFDEKGNLAD
ncbi:MAG: DUF2088 domain-containing protein [Deltaproteobacteria bacterium]|nr:DUF2088 domain-containing protein [Deltaproteobacteria bacterium]